MSATLPKPALANAPFAPAVRSDKDLLRRVCERHAAKVAKMATAEKIAMQARASALLHPTSTVGTVAALAAEYLRKAAARPAPVPAAATDPRAALLAQLAATKDNAERYRLAEEINNLPVPGAF